MFLEETVRENMQQPDDEVITDDLLNIEAVQNTEAVQITEASPEVIDSSTLIAAEMTEFADMPAAEDTADFDSMPLPEGTPGYDDMPDAGGSLCSEYCTAAEETVMPEDMAALTDLQGAENSQSFEEAAKAGQYVPRTVIKEAEYDYYLVESGAVIRIDAVPDEGCFCSLFSAEELYGSSDSDASMSRGDAFYVSLAEQDSLITVWFSDNSAFQADNGDVAGIDELNISNSSISELVPVNVDSGIEEAAEEVPDAMQEAPVFRMLAAPPRSAAAGTNEMETTPVSWEYGSGIFHSVPYDRVIFGPGIGAEKQGFMATNFLTPDIPEYYRTVSAVSLPEAIASGSYIDMPASGHFMVDAQDRILTTRIYLWTNCVTDMQDSMTGTLSAVGTLYGSKNGSMFIYNQYSSLYPSDVYRYTCMAFYFYEAGTALSVDPATFAASGAVDVNGYTFLNDMDYVDKWQIGAITDFSGNLLPTWHDTGSFTHKDPVISLYTTSSSEVWAMESGETYVGSTSNDNFSLDRGLGLTFRSGAADPLMLTYYVGGVGAVKTTFSAPTVRIKYHLIDSPDGEAPPADATAPDDKVVAYYANTAEEDTYKYLFTKNYNTYIGYDFKGWFDLSAGHISSDDGFSGSVSFERAAEDNGKYLVVTVSDVDFGASGHDALRMELIRSGQSSIIQLKRVGQNTYSAVIGPDTTGAAVPDGAFTVNISSVMAADPFAGKSRAVYSFDGMSQIVNSGLIRARTLNDSSAASALIDFYDAGDGTITVSARNVYFGDAGYDSIRLTAWNQANDAARTSGIMTGTAEGLYQMSFYKNDPALSGNSDVVFHFWFENSSTGGSEFFTGQSFSSVDAIAGYSNINTASVTAGLGYLSLETYKGQPSQITDVDVFGYYTRGRLEGSVTLTKTDEAGTMLTGAEFYAQPVSGFAADGTPMYASWPGAGENTAAAIAEGKLYKFTDNGNGTYTAAVMTDRSNSGYFRIGKTGAPKGYDINNSYLYIHISGGQNSTDKAYASAEDSLTDANPLSLTMADTAWKGRVKVYKKDSLTKESLKGAVFRLEQYDTAAGKYVFHSYLADSKDGSYSADVNYSQSNNGKFRIVEETAPKDYAIAVPNERYFTLEYGGQTDFKFYASDTGAPCAEGEIWYNTRQTADLTINKTVPLGDLVVEHGEQSFVFEISGTDSKGNTVVYHRIISFADVKNVSTAGDTGKGYTASDEAVGNVTRSVTLTDIPAGAYTVKEMKADRYELKNIEIISGNMTAVSNGGEMYASGTLDGNGGEVTFYNEKTDWPGFSDTSSVVNRIGG